MVNGGLLHELVDEKIEEKLRLLIEEMAYPINAGDEVGRAALMLAYECDAPVLVAKLLLNLGARVDDQCAKLKTALHYAVSAVNEPLAREEMIRVLLSYNPNLQLIWTSKKRVH